ncbi:hypothetical protein [Mucilaginibacter lappiensis]|uniref:hypothetical protein n=1 Tax=Mucilaginibacter lappiensis TaxID=354630 RepID=UPI003D19DD1B
MKTSTNVHSWNEIIGFYTDRIHEGDDQMPMLEFVLYLKENPIGERLFAFTDSLRLIISVHNPIEPFRDTLHLEFNQATDAFLFTYYKQLDRKPFVAEYKAESIVDKFMALIQGVGWQWLQAAVRLLR